jgi:hypothetical protein
LLGVAGNQRGDAAALVGGCYACLRNELRLATRRAGTRFTKPVRVTRRVIVPDEYGGGVAPVVAVGPSGDVAVVWTAPATQPGEALTLRARIRRNGRWSSAEQVVGESLPFGHATARIDADGRVVVAWSAQPGVSAGEETEITGPPSFFLATAGPDRRFTPARRLEDGMMTGPGSWLPRTGTIDVELDGRGRGFVGWPGVQSGEQVVRVATLDGSRVGTTQTVGTGVFADLAVAPGGTAAIAWTAGNRLLASIAGGGRFASQPEIIAASTNSNGREVIAIDPLSRRVIAAWTREEGGLPSPWYAVRRTLRR